MIDCGTCTVRGVACADCVVTFLTIPVRADPPDGPSLVPLGLSHREREPAPGRCVAPSAPVDLDEAEQRALGVLARSGLVPPLRLERAV